MKDLSRQKFEENWKQAFDGAEANAPDSVWPAIELDLARVESAAMKKTVLFYKWLAAASVFSVIFLGGAFYYRYTDNDSQILSDANPKNSLNENRSDREQASTGSSKTDPEVESTNSIKEDETVRKPSIAKMSIPAITQKAEGSQLQEETVMVRRKNISGLDSEPISLLASMKETPANVQGEIVVPRLVLPAMPAAFMASAVKKTEKDELWASVGFSTGSYNPGYSSSQPAFSSSNSVQDNYLNSVGYSNPSNTGTSYSAGFVMSKRVFSRWVLQSGINYLNQSIGYTSNYVSYAANNQAKAFVAEYATFANQSVTITSPYQINSAIEVMSVPMQAGYLLIDRKIGWQLNTGLAADFFVRNTLADQSGNANRYSQSTGEKSPYRTVSWAGLLSTELSYKVAKQYRVSVVPGLRYSVSSVLKSTSNQTSNPFVADIGLRFRYIFK